MRIRATRPADPTCRYLAREPCAEFREPFAAIHYHREGVMAAWKIEKEVDCACVRTQETRTGGCVVARSGGTSFPCLSNTRSNPTAAIGKQVSQREERRGKRLRTPSPPVRRASYQWPPIPQHFLATVRGDGEEVPKHAGRATLRVPRCPMPPPRQPRSSRRARPHAPALMSGH